MTRRARCAVRAAATAAWAGSGSLIALSSTTPSLVALRSQRDPCPSLHRSFAYWARPSRVLLSTTSPSTPASTTTSPADSSSESSSDAWWRPPRRSLRSPRPPRTADLVSPSRRIMTYLTQHGPQTRRALYAIFGPTPPAPSAGAAPSTAASPLSPPSVPAAYSPENAAAAAVLSSSPIVTSQPIVLRSKRHLTVLLQQLTRSGRVLTKLQQQQQDDSDRRRAASGKPGKGGSGAGSGLRVYEMRDYSKSSRKVQQLPKAGTQQKAPSSSSSSSAAAAAASAAAGKGRQSGSRGQRRERPRQRLAAGRG